MQDYLESFINHDLPQKSSKLKPILATIIVILVIIIILFLIIFWNLPADESKLPTAIIVASKTEIYQGEEILFSASNSFDSDGDIESVKWEISKEGEFGNETYNLENFNLTFHEIGKFKVKLTIRDNDNNYDDEIVSITVLQAINIEIYDLNLPNNFKLKITNNGGRELILDKDNIYFQIFTVKSNKYDCKIESIEDVVISAYGFTTIELDPEYYYNDIADKLIFTYDLNYGLTIKL